jgi:hypothetical protein
MASSPFCVGLDGFIAHVCVTWQCGIAGLTDRMPITHERIIDHQFEVEVHIVAVTRELNCMAGCAPGDGLEICKSLKTAGEQFIADEETRRGNPFIAASPLVEPVTGILAKVQLVRTDLKMVDTLGSGE